VAVPFTGNGYTEILFDTAVQVFYKQIFWDIKSSETVFQLTKKDIKS